MGWARPEVTRRAAARISRQGGIRWSSAACRRAPSWRTTCALDPDAEQVVILTGPNMAGKSTYLRQVALIVLLAQVGSFVPGRPRRASASVDRIFTRVGAHDDLAAGHVHLHGGDDRDRGHPQPRDPRILVILDEIGRGTSTYDGLSHRPGGGRAPRTKRRRLGCRTLFATHYHELTALAGRLPRVRNARVEVLEEGDSVRFLHRIVAGRRRPLLRHPRRRARGPPRRRDRPGARAARRAGAAAAARTRRRAQRAACLPLPAPDPPRGRGARDARARRSEPARGAPQALRVARAGRLATERRR